ncbi:MULTISPECIES: hypothetical protein [unclassified Arthrobacter]|uniref:hypothetical protein n=1 Tax=unclassified Pseudarthrobacter TaxID=2647000 RepID=UPI003398A066
MKLHLVALSAATLMIALNGCGQVQDAANKAVSDGASQVATITTPLRQIADSGDQVPADSVKALQDACTK